MEGSKSNVAGKAWLDDKPLFILFIHSLMLTIIEQYNKK